MFDTRQAANKIGCSKSFLEKLRVTGGGPTFIKLGRAVRYQQDALEQWVAERRCRSTTDMRLSRKSKERRGEDHGPAE